MKKKKKNKTMKKRKKKKKKELTFADLLNKYEAICMMEWEKSTKEIINTCEYVRPSKKRM